MPRQKKKRHSYSIFVEAKTYQELLKTLEQIYSNLQNGCIEQQAGLHDKYTNVRYKATDNFNFEEAVKCQATAT